MSIKYFDVLDRSSRVLTCHLKQLNVNHWLAGQLKVRKLLLERVECGVVEGFAGVLARIVEPLLLELGLVERGVRREPLSRLGEQCWVQRGNVRVQLAFSVELVPD